MTYAAPAVNLFEKTLDRLPVKSNQHEYPVVADRSHPLDYEVNRIVSVQAHIPGAPEKVAVAPLYSAAAGAGRDGLCYQRISACRKAVWPDPANFEPLAL